MAASNVQTNPLYIKHDFSTKEQEDEDDSETDDAWKCPSDLMPDDKVASQHYKDTIEVLSEDMQLSLKVPKSLSTINDRQELYYKHDIGYKCQLCHRTILIINKNLDLSATLHFSKDHKNINRNGNTIAESIREQLQILASLPHYYRQHKLITIEDNVVVCKLCSRTVSLNENYEITCEDLKKHFKDPSHTGQFQSFYKHLGSVTCSGISPQTDESNIFAEFDGFKTVIETLPLIKANLQYISKVNENYHCSLCKRNIPFPKTLLNLIINFNFHFKEKQHKLFVKKNNEDEEMNKTDESNLIKQNIYPVKSSTLLILSRPTLKKMLSKLSRDLVVDLNSHYFDVIESQVYCKVCDEAITVDEQGSQIVTHCQSDAHNDRLALNSINFRAALVKRGLISESPIVNERLKARWESITESYLFHRVPSLSPLIYVKRNFLKCLICFNVLGGKKFDPHFFTNMHRESSQILNCDKDVDDLVSRYSRALNRHNKVALRKLQELSKRNPVVFNNKDVITVEDGMYYCKLCEKSVVCTNDGIIISHMNKHFEK